MFLRTKLGHPPLFLQQNSGVTPTLVRRFTDCGIDLHLTHNLVTAEVEPCHFGLSDLYVTSFCVDTFCLPFVWRI